MFKQDFGLAYIMLAKATSLQAIPW